MVLRPAGRIMRSACPSNANEADIDTIRQKLGITQLVCCSVLHTFLPLVCLYFKGLTNTEAECMLQHIFDADRASRLL